MVLSVGGNTGNTSTEVVSKMFNEKLVRRLFALEIPLTNGNQERVFEIDENIERKANRRLYRAGLK